MRRTHNRNETRWHWQITANYEILIDARGLRCASSRRETGALLVSIGSRAGLPRFLSKISATLRARAQREKGRRERVGPQARRSRPRCNCTAIKCVAERIARLIYASLPAMRLLLPLPSPPSLLLLPLLFLVLLPVSSGSPWRDSSSLLVSRRREEWSSRISIPRRRWTRPCALIKYYARLTERRARKRLLPAKTPFISRLLSRCSLTSFANITSMCVFT